MRFRCGRSTWALGFKSVVEKTSTGVTMLFYPTKVIARGSFAQVDILVEHITLPPLPADIQTRVDKVWAEELARHPKATPGELLAAAGLEAVGGKLLLRCGISNYRNFMGTTSSE